MTPEGITAQSIYEVKTFVTKVDEYILLRINASDGEHWFRLHRSDFLEFAAFITHDAKQIKGPH